jgi:1,2-diacylglycerol 3-alpha-glucosyltransferase
MRGDHGPIRNPNRTVSSARFSLGQNQSPAMMNNGKLLVIFASFGPRHRAKAMVLRALDPDSLFLEIAGSDSLYHWEESTNDTPFPLVRVFPSKKRDELSRIGVVPKLFKTLNDLNPQVVMYPGVLEPGYQTVAVWSKLKNVPGILHYDTWHDYKPRVPWQQFLKGSIYNYFYKYAFVAGQHSKDYLISMGFPEQNISVGCDVVDNDYFKEKSMSFKNQTILREQEGLQENYFLVVARYSPEKDHKTLLQAYRQYLDRGFDWQLVLIGEGPIRQSIEDQINTLNLADHVIQKGWISYPKIPIYYAFARCLILPSSSEPWGLAVNEAAACGLPLILSNKCGCAPELCMPGRNGFIFEAGDAEQLCECMTRMADGSVDLAAFGEQSRELVAPFTFENWARKVLEIKKLLLADQQT